MLLHERLSEGIYVQCLAQNKYCTHQLAVIVCKFD